MVLFFIGGFQNGYTYFARGNVFANLQTGNMILLVYTICFEQGARFMHFLIPLIAFGCGIFIATRHRLVHHGKLKWQSHLLMVQSILFLVCMVLPSSLDDLANALISFNAAMTISAFQHFKGIPMASTMMIGNFRAVITHLAAYSVDHQKHHLSIGLTIASLMLVFLIGTVVAALLVLYMQRYAIALLIPLTLLACYGIEKQSTKA